MYQKSIKLPCRYRDCPSTLKFKKEISSELAKNRLVYELKPSEYVRFILEPQEENFDKQNLPKIISVDPPGGPFMSVGDTDIIKGMKLIFIKDTPSGVYLTFEETSV